MVESQDRNRSSDIPLEAALAYLNECKRSILSGGTDYFPALNDQNPAAELLSVGQISGLGSIEQTEQGWRIGAGVTWSGLIQAELPDYFACLKQAGAEVGSIQIQNRATVAGNLCNASPAADGVPALLALDASVELASVDGTRTLPLSEFITGVRATALRDNEMVTAICVPHQFPLDPKKAFNNNACDQSHFIKLGSRTYLVISIVMCASRIRIGDGGIIEHVALAVGACSPVATRLPHLEQQLLGLRVDSGKVTEVVLDADLSALSPISDVRATADYRLSAARTLLKRQLTVLTASLQTAQQSMGQ